MKKDIFDNYPSTANQGGKRAYCGGVEEFKELPYSPPKGPTNQMQKGPGLHGTNHGNSGTQGKR